MNMQDPAQGGKPATTDPNLQPPAPQTPPNTPATQAGGTEPPKSGDDFSWIKKGEEINEEMLALLPEQTQKYIKQLRWENSTIRGKYNEAQEKASKASTELTAIQKAQKEQEDARLAEQGKYKELWEQRESDALKEAQAARVQLINARIEVQALAAGVPPELVKYIEKDGCSVTASGTVDGAKEAVEKWVAANTRVVDAYKKSLETPEAEAGAAGAGAKPGDSTNPGEYMVMPGTGMTFGELSRMADKNKNLANTGGSLPQSAPTPPKKFSAVTASEEERAARLAKIKGL